MNGSFATILKNRKINVMKNTHRYLARITLETTTALSVGSGGTALLTEAMYKKIIMIYQ